VGLDLNGVGGMARDRRGVMVVAMVRVRIGIP